MSEREDQLSEAAEEKRIMQSLIESAGWKLLVANMENQISERTNKLDAPLTSQDELFLHEYMKGARASFRFIKDLPEAILSQASEVIEAINTETEEIEDGGTNGTSSGDGAKYVGDFKFEE